MRDKETLCQYKEPVNKWALSTKSLKRNNYSEIPNKKCLSAKNFENKHILTLHATVPGLTADVFGPFSQSGFASNPL